MSTTEDFKNAPIAATAIRKDGIMAIKIGDGERYWLTPVGTYLDDEEMMILGYTLKQIIPTTAHEALDLAWYFAHEVKPGQVIPKGARYLTGYNSEVKEYTAQFDIEITPELAHVYRTLKPLPEPEPDWLDAPAVIATCEYCGAETFHTPTEGIRWKCTPLEYVRRWKCTKCRAKAKTSRALTDVTPLYPKGQEA